jgi:hypothetical protein
VINWQNNSHPSYFGVYDMSIKIFGKSHHLKLMLAILLPTLLLIPVTVGAQQSTQGSKPRTKTSKHAEDVTGKLTVKASPDPGVAEVVLENYTGSPLKGIQFRVLATSMNQIDSVLLGSSVSDKSIYAFSYNIVTGTSSKSGIRTDSINIVIFANGRDVVFPSEASVKLVDIKYRRPTISAPSARKVGFKISDVLAGLPNATAASVNAGPKVALILWK